MSHTLTHALGYILAQTNDTNTTNTTNTTEPVDPTAIPSDALIASDFGLLSMTLLIGVFFYVSVEFRSPLGVVFTGVTSLSMIGYLSGFNSAEILFVTAFITIIMLTLAAIHSG